MDDPRVAFPVFEHALKFINSEQLNRIETEVSCFFMSTHLVTRRDWKKYNSLRNIDYGLDVKNESENDFLDLLPIVSINYYEACEFCSWVSSTEKKFRLPTALEWEAAVRGYDGWHYPWGNQFEENRCPSLDQNSIGPSPIGAYPDGASIFGIQDAVGSVWQWTSTYNNIGEVAIKGGSWLDSAWGLRADRTFFTEPNLATCNTGFRFVVEI